jgi:hypothetical protein
VVRGKQRLAIVAHADFVGVFFAGQTRGVHAFADLDALHGVDRHHRGGKVCVELGVDWRAKACGCASHDDFDLGPHGRAGLAQAVEVILPRRRCACVRRPEGVPLDLVPVDIRAVDAVHAHPGHVAANFDPWRNRLDRLAGKATCRHPRCGLACGRTPAATRIADAVFEPVADVGVTGAEFLGDVAVVLGPLVGVLDHELHRGARRLPLVDAREDAHLVGFAPLRGELVLPRFASVEPVLDHAFVDGDARRHTVHRSPQGRSVAFAPGGHAKDMSEGVHHGPAPLALRYTGRGEFSTRE